ncbi:MAG: hypothetical protein IK109_01550 [Clostridiales bacterium]|nr:hypothetical protein [Clostridiales bacterium]MBR5416697.1 hypothetical protein [Clostridiales bacterium]
MKKQPVQNANRPTYPTLYQVNSRTGNVPIKKIAVVSALTASMALMSGCLEENGSKKSMGRFEKMGEKFGQQTETYIEGEIETLATDDYVLGGEAETVATDDYVLAGAADTEATDDYVVMGDMVEYTDDYELTGGETVETECTVSYEIVGDMFTEG